MARNQIVKTYSLSPETVERIQRLADATKRDYSTIVEMSVELLATQDEFAHINTPTKRTALEAIPGLHKGAAA